VWATQLASSPTYASSASLRVPAAAVAINCRPQLFTHIGIITEQLTAALIPHALLSAAVRTHCLPYGTCLPCFRTLVAYEKLKPPAPFQTVPHFKRRLDQVY